MLDDLERWLREVLPPARSTEEREVPVSFWSHGAHGRRAFSRRIVVPEWSGIADNYPSAVREQLTRLVTPSFRPVQGGQLLLWYGPPARHGQDLRATRPGLGVAAVVLHALRR